MKFKTHIGPPPQEDDVPTLCWQVVKGNFGPKLQVYWNGEWRTALVVHESNGLLSRNFLPSGIPLRLNEIGLLKTTTET